MPICPKCGKNISPKKYKRHIERCGSTHKHRSGPMPPSGDNYFMKM